MHCALQDTGKKTYPAAVGGKFWDVGASSEDWLAQHFYGSPESFSSQEQSPLEMSFSEMILWQVWLILHEK